MVTEFSQKAGAIARGFLPRLGAHCVLVVSGPCPLAVLETKGDTMDLLRTLESAHEQAERRIKARFGQSMMANAGWKKPRFGSEAYRVMMQKGMITPEEAEADEIMRAIRAERTGQQKTAADRAAASWQPLQRPIGTRRQIPPRWGREAPIPSDQYSPNMATTAARDNRLTPQAKALLQVLHARCVANGSTETTKGTLANIMGRCERTIQRYIADLVRFGYIETKTRRNGRGLYNGLVIVVTGLVKPCYEALRHTAKLITPILMASSPESLGFLDRTILSPKKRLDLFKTTDTPNGVNFLMK